MGSKRRRFLIDWAVQGALVRRICGHWLAFLCATIIALPLFRAIVCGDIASPLSERLKSAGVDALVLVVIFAFLLPCFIYDSLRISNKFAGPVFRLHRTIRELAEGKTAAPVSFRDDDFWQEVATDFNQMVTHLQSQHHEEPRSVEEEELVAG